MSEDDPTIKSPRKRRAEEHSSGAAFKRRQPKAPKMPRKIMSRDAGLDLDSSINTDFGFMGSDMLAEHLAKQTARFEPDLSVVELEERRMPVTAIRNATDFEPDRTLEHMPDFLRKFSQPKRKTEDLSKSPKEKGSPHTLVLAGAGLRSADITRKLRVFQTQDNIIAKLFAKHIKLEEAKDHVKKTRIGIGVGTPKRISDLLDAEALSTAKLERIVIDASHIDQKKRGILDMKELLLPLIELLNRPELKERYGLERGQIELIFY